MLKREQFGQKFYKVVERWDILIFSLQTMQTMVPLMCTKTKTYQSMQVTYVQK